MLATERGEFRAVMERLGRVFDRTVSDDLLTDYWAALQDIPLAVLRERVATHMRVGKFFPKPRDLRENPDGERRIADTRSPDPCVDDWTATLNRVLRNVLMTVGGVPDAALGELVAEKNRIAAQMRAGGTTADEWAGMVEVVKARLLAMAQAARRAAGWQEWRGLAA